jgi:PKHD-type hydroxylase
VQLDYHYWTFDNVVSDETRDFILNGLESETFQEGRVINKEGEGVINKKSRDNKYVFLGGQFLRDVFTPYINSANKSSGWNYDIDWLEDVQVARYGVGEHYGWHHDAISHDKRKSYHKNYEGRARKLTALTLLTDDFSGGEFELSCQIRGSNDNTDIVVFPVDLPLGTIVVFPSFLWHRVKPVTSGTRSSMQMWCLGPPFK